PHRACPRGPRRREPARGTRGRRTAGPAPPTGPARDAGTRPRMTSVDLLPVGTAPRGEAPTHTVPGFGEASGHDGGAQGLPCAPPADQRVSPASPCAAQAWRRRAT